MDETETTAGPVQFDYDEAGVLLDALENYATGLRFDQFDALAQDTAADCDIFVTRILEHFGGDPRLA